MKQSEAYELEPPPTPQCKPNQRFRCVAEIVRNHNDAGLNSKNGPADEKPVSHADEADFAKSYDPYDFGKAHHATSFWGTVFHVIIIIANPGMLSVPSTLVGVGYLFGLLVMPPLFWLYVHNASMLVWSEYQICKTRRVQTLSYSQVAYHAFDQGPQCGRWLATWSRTLSCIDFLLVWISYYCINYVLMGQNLQLLLSNIFQYNISTDTALIVLGIPQILLACIPKLKYLVPFSLGGSVFNSLSLLLIVYFVATDSSAWQIPHAVGPLSSVPLFIGSLLMNMNVAGMLIPLKNEMKDPNRFTSGCGVLTAAFLFAYTTYTGFSLICALKYGHAIQSNVTKNLSQTNPIAQISTLLSTLAIVCMLPLVMHVPYDVIWNQKLKNVLGGEHSTAYEYFLRIFLVIFSVSVCVAVPNIYLFVSLSGTIGTSIDSLLLPALIHTVVVKNKCENKWKFRLIFVKNMAIVALAVVLIVTGGLDCVQQIVVYYSGQS